MHDTLRKAKHDIADGSFPAPGTIAVPNLTRRRLLRRGNTLAGLSLFGFAGSLAAQPRTPGILRLVVPFPPGGSVDLMARAAATTLTARLKRQVIVDNRPGAGGNIAAEQVAHGPADGSTVLVAGQAILAINKALYPRLSYDPDTAFTYLNMLGSFPNVLTINPAALPVGSVAELIALARRNPGTIAYGSNGSGSLSHLTTELLASSAGVKFLHVPYGGASGGLMTDLLAGRIAFTMIGTTSAMPSITAGRLRALAVSSGQRFAPLRTTPTLVESGFPMLDAPTWFAAVASTDVPTGVIYELRNAIARATSSPAYADALTRQLSVPMSLSLDASTPFLNAERKKWQQAVRTSGATIG